MSFKSRIIAVLVIIALGGTLIYGSKLTISGREESAGRLSWLDDSKETVYFWYSDEALTDYISGAAVAFGEREHVRVIPYLCTENEYVEAINDASVKGEQFPDAYIVSNECLEKAYLGNLAVQVNDYDSTLNESNFPKTALNAVTYKDKYIGYPLCYEMAALVYNETYLKDWAEKQATNIMTGTREDDGGETEERTAVAPEVFAIMANDIISEEEKFIRLTDYYFNSGFPTTVADILEIADTYNVPEGVEGIMEWDVTDIFYNYWVIGNYVVLGGETGDDKSLIDIANDNTKACLSAYEELNQFFSMSSDTTSYESVIKKFVEGKIVFTLATTDIIKTLETAKADGSFAYDYGIAPVPDINDELQSRTLSVTEVVAVNGYSLNKEAANKFAAFLVNDYADELYWTSGKLPARSDAEDFGPAIVYNLEYASSISLPKLLETENYWMQTESMLAQIWGGADVNTTLEKTAAQIAVQITD
ncbi:MAG: extracellular solute-binding protein [Acetatifactor sp.]|nr:extracellular solute-binding protein [Acetatifactor sp.]